MDNYLESLNESQREAVEIISGSTLVLAGAGSGKTRVLTYKLLHLLVKKILTPNQILAVTFTNKAAAEMSSRVSDMVNFPIDRMWLGTFHSLSLKILRKHYEKINLKQNFVIIDTDDQLKLIKKICDQEKIDTKDISPKFFSTAIDNLKNKGIFANELKPNKYRNYDEELEEAVVLLDAKRAEVAGHESECALLKEEIEQTNNSCEELRNSIEALPEEIINVVDTKREIKKKQIQAHSLEAENKQYTEDLHTKREISVKIEEYLSTTNSDTLNEQMQAIDC